MTERNVQDAFLAAKEQTLKTLEGMTPDQVWELTHHWYNELSPFQIVQKRIREGDLSTGDPLKDAITIRHGLEHEQILNFYQKIDSHLASHPNQLIARVEPIDYVGEKRPLDPKKDKGRVFISITTQEPRINVDLNSNSITYGGSLASPEIFTELGHDEYMAIFPKDSFRRNPTSQNYGSGRMLDLTGISYLCVDHEVVSSPDVKHGNSTLIIGDVAVRKWFSNGGLNRFLGAVQKRLV